MLEIYHLRIYKIFSETRWTIDDTISLLKFSTENMYVCVCFHFEFDCYKYIYAMHTFDDKIHLHIHTHSKISNNKPNDILAKLRCERMRVRARTYFINAKVNVNFNGRVHGFLLFINILWMIHCIGVLAHALSLSLPRITGDRLKGMVFWDPNIVKLFKMQIVILFNNSRKWSGHRTKLIGKSTSSI